MKRDICKQLVSWKQSSSRKPLVLKGARQVGKTYILKKLGKGEYGSKEAPVHRSKNTLAIAVQP